MQGQGMGWSLEGGTAWREDKGEKIYPTDRKRRVEEFKAKSAKEPSSVKKRVRRRMDSKLKRRTGAQCSETSLGSLEGSCGSIYKQTGRRKHGNQVK